MEDENTGLNSALDELLRGKTTEQISGPNGLLKQLTKALLERAMNAELSHHLGDEKGQAEGRGSGNNRNGSSRKRVQGDFGSVEVAVPRDRNGSFEPQILPKHKRRWTGLDDKIISMYTRGMSTRDIEGHLREIYSVDVSATLISQVTEEVMEEVRAWQSRPLEPLYMIVYLMRWSSRCGMKGEWRTGRCSLPSASRSRAPKKCWGFGPARRKAPSCGCRS